MTNTIAEEWDLWYPQAGATGIPFARGKIGTATHVLLVHAAPPVLAVTVRDGDGKLVATSDALQATQKTPITRLTRSGKTITRSDIWPTPQDIESLVLLPGGEVGVLKEWWHAEDHSEWRWILELSNKASS